MMRHIKNRGFTLIELLVVISIIGLLSSVVIASLNNARSKGKDSKRMSDVVQLQRALEIYYDTYETYPVSSWVSSGQSTWNTSANPLYALVTNNILSSLPVDPKNDFTGASNVPANQYAYTYFSTNYPTTPSGSGKWYMISFNLENAQKIEQSDGAYTCSTTNPTAGTYNEAGQFHFGNNTTDHRVTVGGGCATTRTANN